MRGRKFFWYSLNIYPTTRDGVFKMVLLKRWGFHWHCKKHPVPKCKDCTDFGTNDIVSVWTTDALETTDLYELLDRLADAIKEGNTSKNQGQAYLKPLSKP